MVKYFTLSINTDLGRLIGNFDCEYSKVRKSINFPAILKSFLADFRGSKSDVLGYFWVFWHFTLERVSKFRAFNSQNSSFFGLQYDQNWFYVKSEWQKNPEIFTFCKQYLSTILGLWVLVFRTNFAIFLSFQFKWAYWKEQDVLRYNVTVKLNQL